MNFLQMRVVFEIARRNFNMSEAAAVLHRSQPAVSSQLAELEQELGLRIFSRTKNKLNNHQLKLVGLCCGLKVRIRVA